MMDMSYDVLRKVGEGTFGEVFQGYHRETGEIVALKRIRIRNMQAGLPRNVIREIQALENIECQNVVALHEYFPLRSSIVLVLDYMATDLHKVLELCRTRSCVLPTKLIRFIMRMLLTAIKSIHDHYVIHRDIKPSNLLLSETGVLKLGDFGTCRTDLVNAKQASAFTLSSDSQASPESDTSSSVSTSISLASLDAAQYSHEVGTRWYRSPELLFGARKYSRATDMWSVGCILGELLLGAPLFQGDNDIDQLYRIFKCVGSPTGVQNSPSPTKAQASHDSDTISSKSSSSTTKGSPNLQKRKSSTRIPLKQASSKAIDSLPSQNQRQASSIDNQKAPKDMNPTRKKSKSSMFSVSNEPLVHAANFWPEAADLPDFAKIYFPEFTARHWQEILPSDTDALALDLLSRFLVLDPSKRITPEEALQHPFIQLRSNESKLPPEDEFISAALKTGHCDKKERQDHGAQSFLADLVMCTLVDGVSRTAISKACSQGLRKYRQKLATLPFRQQIDQESSIAHNLFMSDTRGCRQNSNCLKAKRGYVFNRGSGILYEGNQNQCESDSGLAALSENGSSGSTRNTDASVNNGSIPDEAGKLLLTETRSNSFLLEGDASDGDEVNAESGGEDAEDSIDNAFTILATVWSSANDDSAEDSELGGTRKSTFLTRSTKKKFNALKGLKEDSPMIRRGQEFFTEEDDIRSFSGESGIQVPLNISVSHNALKTSSQENPSTPVQFKPNFSLLKLNTTENDATHPSMASTPTVSELRKHRRNLSRSSELQTRRQSQPMHNPPDEDDRLVDMQTVNLVQDIGHRENSDHGSEQVKVVTKEKGEKQDEESATTDADTQSNSLVESRLAIHPNRSQKHPLCYLELKYLPRCPIVQIRTTFPNFKESENAGLLVLKTTAQEQYLRGQWSLDSLSQKAYCMDLDPQLARAFTDITSCSSDSFDSNEPNVSEQKVLPTDPGLYGDNRQLAFDLEACGLYSFESSFDKRFEQLCLETKLNSNDMSSYKCESEEAGDEVEDNDPFFQLEPLWLPSSAFPLSISECQTYHNELLQSKLFDIIVNHPNSEFD